MAPNDFLSALLSGSSGSSTGSDAALNAFKNNLGQSDYYKMAAAPLLSAKFDTSTWKPAESFAATAAQSFLGTALQMLGQKSESDQLLKAAAVLPQLQRDPMSVGVPEGVDPGAFAALKMSAIKDMFDRGEAVDKLKQQFILSRLGKDLDVAKEIESAGPIAEAKKRGEMDATNALPGGADANPESPQNKRMSQVAKFEDDLRTELSKSKPASSVEAALSALPSLQRFAQDNTKTSDIPFVYKFVQAQDGGVVKEGEVTMVQGASPLIARFQAQLNGALKGESTLTPDIKKQMVEEMKAATRDQWAALKSFAEPRLQTGESRGGSRKNMLPFSDESLAAILGEPAQSVSGASITPELLASSLQSILAKAKARIPLTADEEAIVERARGAIAPKPANPLTDPAMGPTFNFGDVR